MGEVTSGAMTGLPAERTSFVGRRHEMAEIRRLLAELRLVTLVGLGGVGKTRASSSSRSIAASSTAATNLRPVW